MKITVLLQGGEKRVLPYCGEENLLRLFALHGMNIPARCGGTGKCGKCRVRLVSGKLKGGETIEDGVYLSCKAKPLADCEISLKIEEGNGIEEFRLSRSITPHGAGLGIAVDLGTTTIAASLLDLHSGKVLGTASRLNPQAVFGSDVLSRIRACESEESFHTLTNSVRKAIGELANQLIAKRGDSISRMTLAGNTTMLHLFCGVDPSPLGIAPFNPVFTDKRTYRGETFKMKAGEITVLPSISAFVGADISADLLATDLIRAKDNVLLVDLGTNGEMALKSGEKFVCTSTAAGPALEGACISCGVGGIAGAINRVWIQGEGVAFSTIGSEPPVGICGAGLVDLIAALLDLGKIDETGYLAEEKYFLCENVYLTRADVRQFQLAKAAISAGIVSLLNHEGLTCGDISRCLIAGGLGSYMNVKSAVRVGLIPAEFEENTFAVGNGSLYGAQLYLLDETCRAETDEIMERATAIDLSGDGFFADEFVERMCFEEP